MSAQSKFRQDTKVSDAELNSNELLNNQKKRVATNADYYSEWAVENCSVEKPKSKKPVNSAEPASGFTYQTSNSEQYY